MSNIIDSIQLSGVTYQIQGSGSTIIDPSFDSGSTNPVENRVITPAVTKHFEGEYPTEYTGGYSGGTYVGGFSAETYEEAASYVIRNSNLKTRLYKDGMRMKFIDAEGVETEVFACSASTYYQTVSNPPSSYATITIDSTGKIEITPLDNYKLSYVVFYAYYDNNLMSSTNNAFSAFTYQSFNKTAIQLIDELSAQKQDKIPISAGTGTNSIIEGSNTTASGTNSHAEGYYTHANGYASHAEGQSTFANDSASHAEGSNSRANGLYSHAEGSNTTASGNYSHTEGNNTVAYNRSEHASGQFNVSNSATTTFGNSGNTLFSVGNGTEDDARHNAFEIRQNGDIYLTSGGTDIKLQDHLGGGGNPTVELTQAEYDALVTAGTVSADTYYIITDAQAGDLTQYWTSAQTNSAITQAVSGKANSNDVYLKTETSGVTQLNTAFENKQDTLVSGFNIKTINNESILGAGNIDIQGGGGGGKAVTGGTNISVTTGATADTINCTLPISASSEGIYTTSSYPFSSSARKTGNVVFGYNNILDTFGSSNQSNYNTFFGSNHYISTKGDNMFIAGSNNRSGYPSNNSTTGIVLFGFYNKSSNPHETAFGSYNVSQYSSDSFGNSGNTLFSVGNGTADNARHNAFEIKQNGDIYLSSGGTDIKLQDHLGGGGGSITIDPTLDSGSTNAVANSAITEAFNGVTYGSPSTFSSAFVGSRTAYAIIYDVPTRQNITKWYFRCFDSSVPSYTNVGIMDNNYFYDGSTSQIFTDVPDWIDQELSYYDSTTRKRYVFLKNGVYADYFGNVNNDTFTIFETNNTGLIGSLLSKHSIDTVAHTTSAEKTAWNAKLDSSAITTSVTSSSTDSQIPSAKAVNDKLGGLSIVKLTQAEYDALATKDNSTLYVIVN